MVRRVACVIAMLIVLVSFGATAQAWAQEIAGDAYNALRDYERLEKTLKAIRNAIGGYGDEYLIPNHAALDELAEEDASGEVRVSARRLLTQSG